MIRWILLLNQLAVLLLINIGALVLLMIALSTAVSILIAVNASAQGHPLDPETLRIVSNSFIFVLGSVTAIGILSALDRVVAGLSAWQHSSEEQRQ